jgi:hypothetical protein
MSGIQIGKRGNDPLASAQPTIQWGITVLSILGITSLLSASGLVIFAMASDNWFKYDAKYGGDINVAMNRPDQDGFDLDSDGKYMRWIIQTSNLLFIVIAFGLFSSYRLVNRARGDFFHVIAILWSILPLLSSMATFGLKASLSRTETYVVALNSTSNATRTYVGQGDRFSLDHAPRMVIASFGLAMVFVFCLQYIISVFSFYFYQKADLKFVNNAPGDIDGKLGFACDPPAYNAKSS